jgi:hypothetical protein
MRSESADVRRHADEHLRRFVAARRAGDRAAMRRWWNELVVDLFDRADSFVYLAHRGRLDPDEHEDAVELTLAKLTINMMETFAGTSMGELVNATKTLARGVCIDVQRAAARRAERSLDAGWHADGDDAGPPPAWEAGAAWARHEQAQRAAEARDFLAWALPQLNADRRQAVELTLAGADADAIAAELQITRDNAYQRRSRGLRDLRRLKERYDA